MAPDLWYVLPHPLRYIGGRVDIRSARAGPVPLDAAVKAADNCRHARVRVDPKTVLMGYARVVGRSS